MASDQHLVLAAPNWLGDVIMAQPAMRSLAAQARRVSVCGRPWLADLLPYLNLQHASYRSQIPKDAEVAIIFPNSFRAAWLAWRASIRKRVGFCGQWRRLLLTSAYTPRFDMRHEHHRNYYLDLVEQMGLSADHREVSLAVSSRQKEEGVSLMREHGLNPDRVICVAPGSQFGSAKRYPATSYANVLKRLSKSGWQPLILGTVEERGTGDRCLSHTIGPCWNAAGETSLGQALQLLAACQTLLCNDSGLMHVAAGMGKPVVAIFGATDPARTAPSGPNVRLLFRPADCSPCLQRECTVSGQPCMANVPPEEVYSACLEQLA